MKMLARNVSARTRRLLNSHFGDQVDKEIWEYPEITAVEPSVPLPVPPRQDGDFRIYIQKLTGKVFPIGHSGDDLLGCTKYYLARRGNSG